MPSPGMQTLFRQMERKTSLSESTVQKAIQQRVVEHEEHNRPHRKLWSSTASGSASRRLDSCLASGHSQVRKREWGWLCAPFLTVIQLAVHAILICQHASTCIHNLITHWTASSEFGTYHLCEQRRFRRACASAQSRQNLRCSLIQAVNQEEPSDRKSDPWPLRMAGHAQLKFVMTECSKTQIRLTGLTLIYTLTKVLWRWASGEAAGVGHTEICRCRPAHRRLSLYGRFPQGRSSKWDSAVDWVTEQPFLGPHCSPQ